MAGQEFESSEKVVIKEGVAEQSFDAEDADSNCNNILVDDESESAEDENLKEDKTKDWVSSFVIINGEKLTIAIEAIRIQEVYNTGSTTPTTDPSTDAVKDALETIGKITFTYSAA